MKTRKFSIASIILALLALCELSLFSRVAIGCKSNQKEKPLATEKETERLEFYSSYDADHPFIHRAIALGEETRSFRYWKSGEVGGLMHDGFLVSGGYSWSQDEKTLTLSNDFGQIILHKEIMNGQEVLINKERSPERVSREGWILIQSNNESLESPFAN
jgi:hypothetical protein